MKAWICLLGLLSPTALSLPDRTEMVATSIPAVSSPDAQGVVERAEGDCRSKHQATEEWFNAGAVASCRLWFETKKDANSLLLITVPNPVGAFSDLEAYDGGDRIRYKYVVKINSPDGRWREYPTRITESECVEGFKNIIRNGSPGHGYCAVADTGTILSSGGTFQKALNSPNPKLTFEVKVLK